MMEIQPYRADPEDYGELPQMFRVRQKFPRDKLNDLEAHLIRQMGDQLHCEKFRDKRMAVAVGSRGISNLSEVVFTVVSQLKHWGAKPFIVPAMGSHGGARAEGQIEVLAHYGITEEAMGVPVCASMEVVQAGSLDGLPVYFDKITSESDGIVVINRVKQHTGFRGDYESGIVKMMTVGLGNHAGALAYHRVGVEHFHKLLPGAARIVMNAMPISFAVALVENAYEDTLLAEIIPPERLMDREKELLIISKKNLPRLLISPIDVLIINEIGKEISGAGMDPNITGRFHTPLPGFEAISYKKIVVLGLTEKTVGNATGVGMADIITMQALEQIDFQKTYANSITSTALESARIPVVAASKSDAVRLALTTCKGVARNHIRVARIKNTLELTEIELSANCYPLVRENNRLEILSAARPFFEP